MFYIDGGSRNTAVRNNLNKFWTLNSPEKRILSLALVCD